MCGSNHHIGVTPEAKVSDPVTGLTRGGGCHDDSIGTPGTFNTLGAGTLPGVDCTHDATMGSNSPFEEASPMMWASPINSGVEEEVVLSESSCLSCDVGAVVETHFERGKTKK